MRLASYLSVVFLFIGFALEAQTVLQLRDQASGAPIPLALVRLGEVRLVTDEQGQVEVPEAVAVAGQEGQVQHLSFAPFRFRLAAEQLGTQVELALAPLSQSLEQVTVQGFDSPRELREQAGAISRISEAEWKRFDETSLRAPFNTQPGIRVEERAPGSLRVSIRGSALRSPFGVRNTKIYWNDIPLTAPDGTTDLNLLDIANVADTEVIRGPAGSIYGAGNGGVINFRPRGEVQEDLIEAAYQVGSFGMQRYRLGVEQKIGETSLRASYVRQSADGYREHSALDRQVLQLQAILPKQQTGQLSLHLLYSDLDYQIPGALNAEQVAANRRQARPGSVEQNSSIQQQSLFASAVHEVRWGADEGWANTTSFYVGTKEFENPFILDYKRETAFFYGGRSTFSLDTEWLGRPLRLVAGGEYQYGLTAALNFGNVNGVADTVRFADDLRTVQGFLFQQAEWQLDERFLLTFGASQNFTTFGIDRSIDAAGGPTGALERRFNPVLVPRVALAYTGPRARMWHASVSSGFSPPTIAEVRTNEGSINEELEAERGINYELGHRGTYAGIEIDATAFLFFLSETITTFTNEQGVVLFRNAGATRQRGIEISARKALYSSSSTWLSQLSTGLAYTGHFFNFADFESGGNDFSGNQLTGVAPHTLVATLDVRSRPGFYLNFTHQYVDALPLNDANTVFQDSFHLMTFRLGWQRLLRSGMVLEVFGGMDNVLDAEFSLGNDLNAFGGRFFQPAPGRNVFAGLKLGLR
ncbi:TonB-dependent receptor [Nitritalea halalkaliphila LW7]|uniref:TonB-dependent receptor n=1 Tax=Nitritalea halalkaliphila LW7 TaxID=1189621 RepID=I5C7E0_9BACT|nr:TonB-dependent receptor [Nitritalea halalkaliphila]EIM77742.1 TonB-dependent receptor [Nitritalea halalkaliphila LW7]